MASPSRPFRVAARMEPAPTARTAGVGTRGYTFTLPTGFLVREIGTHGVMQECWACGACAKPGHALCGLSLARAVSARSPMALRARVAGGSALNYIALEHLLRPARRQAA